MALPSTGQITLNQVHVEVGGTSATQCSLNDADIRALRGLGSGAQNNLAGYRGLSAKSYSKFAAWAASNYPSIRSGGYQPNGRSAVGCYTAYGSPLYDDTSSDSACELICYHSIQGTSAANWHAGSSTRYAVYIVGGYKGYGPVSAATVHGCTTLYWDPWDGYGNNCYYWDNTLNDYRLASQGRVGGWSSFTGP